jgi:hypothetical protein
MSKTKRIAGVVAVVLGIAVCGGAAGAQTDMGWERAAPPENAALLYFRAFLILTSLEGDESDAYARLIKHGEYDAAVLRPCVERNAAPLALLEQGAAISHCDFQVQLDQGIGALMPELARARELGRIGICAMSDAAARGDWDRALAYNAAVFRLARHVHETGTIINSMVAATIIDGLSLPTARMVEKMPAESSRYERMAATLDEVRPPLADWSGAVRGEIRGMMSEFPAPGSRPAPAELATTLYHLFAYLAPEKKATFHLCQRFAAGEAVPDEIQQVADLFGCPAEELGSPASIADELSRQADVIVRTLRSAEPLMKLPYPESEPKLNALREGVPEDMKLARAVLPPFGKMRWNCAQAESRLAMLRAAIALMNWRAEHGAFPASLAELGDTPSDPYTIGQTFGYEKDADTGFTLRSAGTVEYEGKETVMLSITSAMH